MNLLHLGLPVSDVPRSRQFYETYFGFDPATAEQYDDGTVIIRNSDGFDLALHAVGDAGRLPEFLHFGFKVRDTNAVRTLLAPAEGGRHRDHRRAGHAGVRRLQVPGPGRRSRRDLLGRLRYGKRVCKMTAAARRIPLFVPLADPFQQLGSHLPAHHLADHRPRQFVHDEHPARHLVGS